MIATKTVSNTDDLIDIRDVIERIEYLEVNDGDDMPAECEELEALHKFIDQFAGYGGDEQWRDNWYPITLIRDSYFEDYARELAEDVGALNAEWSSQWPYSCIDWEQAARELQMDYTAADLDGVTYWAR